MRTLRSITQWLARRRAQATEEHGVTMLVVLGAMVFTLLTLAALLGYTTNNTRVVRRNVEQKQAYYAAQAALSIYEFRLEQNPNYWAACSTVSTPTQIPGGSPNEYYEFKPLPVSSSVPCSTSNAISTMIDSSGQFRIVFTGMECTTPTCTTGTNGTLQEQRNIVVSFSRTSFLNFVYFTVYETIDPTADPAEPSAASGSGSCYQYRSSRPSSCATIAFATGDTVSGPLHSNDQVAACGSPVFGRSGQSDSFGDNGTPVCTTGASNPTYNGSKSFSAGIETMPPNDTTLAQFASQGAVKGIYYGPTDITLSTGSSGNYSVRNANINGGVSTVESAPSNGVIYVAQNTTGNCQDRYTPFGSVYDDLNDSANAWYDSSDSACGDAYVSGAYDTSLTVASAGDIVITGNLTTNTSGGALLGLIAENFVRLYRPVVGRYADTNPSGYNNSTHVYTYTPYGSGSCGNGSGNDGTGSMSNPTIDAAILAVNGSWIVDNYDCGANENALNINGAIAQVFRGPVATNGNGTTGYDKNYVYDNRLLAEEPPDFLNPVAAGWQASRETNCFTTNSTVACN